MWLNSMLVSAVWLMRQTSARFPEWHGYSDSYNAREHKTCCGKTGINVNIMEVFKTPCCNKSKCPGCYAVHDSLIQGTGLCMTPRGLRSHAQQCTLATKSGSQSSVTTKPYQKCYVQYVTSSYIKHILIIIKYLLVCTLVGVLLLYGAFIKFHWNAPKTT